MINIEKFDHEGRGIGFINNKVVFVEKALPSEQVDLKIIKDTNNYIVAKATKIIKKSNDRIDSKCPYFEKCGGCDLLHMNYNSQLKFKEEKIKNILQKCFNEKIKLNSIVSSENNFFYRNKVVFHVNNDIGFFNKNTNELIKVDECICINKLINKEIINFKKLDLSKIKDITCRVGNSKIMVIINTDNINLDITPISHISCIYLKVNDKYILKSREKYIYQNIDDYIYKISPDAFFQINNEVTKKLYDKIKYYVGYNKKIIDLYCGTGSIGIYISKNNQVIGIEINKSAIEDANCNKEINNINYIDFICDDSSNFIKHIKFNPDIIIVDPPRNGLNKKTLENIIRLIPNNIIYVSCNPITLVRDLKILKVKYDIIEITPFDMFPNTKHIETVCILNKL